MARMAAANPDADLGIDAHDALEPSLGEGPQIEGLGSLTWPADQHMTKGKTPKPVVSASIRLLTSRRIPGFWAGRSCGAAEEIIFFQAPFPLSFQQCATPGPPQSPAGSPESGHDRLF